MIEREQAQDAEHRTPVEPVGSFGVSLRLLESLVGTVVSNIGDAILVTEAGQIDGLGPKIVYANESFTRMTGHTAEEVLGKTPRVLQGPGTDRTRLDEIRTALLEWEPVRAELLTHLTQEVGCKVGAL